MLKNTSARLVKLPADIDFILFLIQEELKSSRLFNGLADIGLHDCPYQAYFGTAVLAAAGFQNRPDDLYEFYMNLIDKRSKKIKPDPASITKQAFRVYIDLMIEKKRRSKNNTITAHN